MLQQVSQCIVRTADLRFEEVLGEAIRQTVVRAIIDLPALGKLPAVQIIDTVASARITRTRVVAGKVIFEGEVDVKIIFEGEAPDQPVLVVSQTFRFSDSVEIPRAEPGAQVVVRATVEDVNVELIRAPGETAAKRLSVTVVIAVLVKVLRSRLLRVVVDVKGPRTLVVKKELLRVRTVIAEASRQVIVRESVNLEDLDKKPFVQLIDTIASARVTSVRVIEDKVLVDGQVDVKILFETPQQEVMAVSQTVAVREFVEVRGARPGQAAEATIVVENVSVVAEDRDGDTDKETLVKTIVLRIEARVFEIRQVQVVVDVTGIPGIRVVKQLVRSEEVIGEGTAQVVVRGLLSPKEQKKPCIVQIIDCRAFPRITEIQIVPNKVLIRGRIELKVLFEAEDQTVHVIRGEFAFEGFLAIPDVEPGAETDVSVIVEDVNCAIPPGLTSEELLCPPVEVIAVLSIFVKAFVGRQLEVITSVVCPTVADPAAREAIVTGDSVNVRSGAGTNFPVVTQVNRGNPVTVVATIGSWKKVVVPGEPPVEGFVFHRFVRLLEDPQAV